MKVLIVRLAAMGDLVFTSCLLTRIRRELPGAHVTWAVLRPLAELVRHFDVDQVVEIDPGILADDRMTQMRAVFAAWARLIPAAPFDRVIVAHEDPRYRVLAAPLRAGSYRMLTPTDAGRRNPIAARYAGDEYARLLDTDPVSRGPRPVRSDIADLRDRIAPAPGTEHRPIVLVPAGGKNARRSSPLRRWPVDRYVELARRFRHEGHSVTLVGDANDAWAQPAFEGLGVDDRIGKTTITETLAIMRGARLVVTHDTGPLHLARLMRAPLVAMFGPQIPWNYIPADANATVLWGGASLACRPCYDPHEPALCTNNLCMQDLSVDRVFGAAMERLADPAAANAAMGSVPYGAPTS
jgi:heptosyltransferase-2